MEQNKNHLENEKKNVILMMNQFLVGIDLQEDQYQGRPRSDIKDIIKCLLVMSYHGWSFRRANCDIETLYQEGHISYIPKRSTLCKYANDLRMIKILKELIQLTSLSFVDIEDCLMVDSSWFGKYMRISVNNYKENRSKAKSIPAMHKTRKMHVAIAKQSKIITAVLCSNGEKHDSPFLQELVESTLSNGFRIKTLLADKGYCSKDHYEFCEEKGIKAYIDFRKNVTGRAPRSILYAKQFKLYKNDFDDWHEVYRYRQLIESIFSTIKRKNRYYLRSRNEISQDVELLLKCFWYNLCIVAKHY